MAGLLGLGSREEVQQGTNCICSMMVMVLWEGKSLPSIALWLKTAWLSRGLLQPVAHIE